MLIGWKTPLPPGPGHSGVINPQWKQRREKKKPLEIELLHVTIVSIGVVYCGGDTSVFRGNRLIVSRFKRLYDACEVGRAYTRSHGDSMIRGMVRMSLTLLALCYPASSICFSSSILLPKSLCLCLWCCIHPSNLSFLWRFHYHQLSIVFPFFLSTDLSQLLWVSSPRQLKLGNLMSSLKRLNLFVYFD